MDSGKRVLALTDGVTGHTRQVEAVAAEIARVWRSQGVPDSRIEIASREIDVKFRRPFLQKFLLYFLKPVLSSEDRKALSSAKADVVVSAFGRRTVDANLWVARRNRAKSVVIMTPRARLKEFDLALIPGHDDVVAAPNIVFTEGAPNSVDDERLSHYASKLESATGKLKPMRTGLFLGGNYKRFVMKEAVIASVVSALKRFAAEGTGADILVTTSRRTPEPVEKRLDADLSSDPACKLLVIANRRNFEGAVPGILGLCQAVVVSPESVSMISEAASSGAHVIVFDEPEFVAEKHRRFLDNLSKKGYIRLCAYDKVYDELKLFAEGKAKTKRLDDGTTIRRALERMLEKPQAACAGNIS